MQGWGSTQFAPRVKCSNLDYKLKFALSLAERKVSKRVQWYFNPWWLCAVQHIGVDCNMIYALPMFSNWIFSFWYWAFLTQLSPDKKAWINCAVHTQNDICINNNWKVQLLENIKHASSNNRDVFKRRVHTAQGQTLLSWELLRASNVHFFWLLVGLICHTQLSRV